MTGDQRQGLNGTLSYPDSTGTVHAFGVRVETISHGLKPIYVESAARARRAFYPHRMSDTQFALGLVLDGQAERQAFTQFLGSFAATMLNPGAVAAPTMRVSVPVRGFERRGIPLSGLDWGAQVGQVVFRPQVVFETSWNPVDGSGEPQASGIPGVGAVGDPAVQFFFPFGTQLSGDQAPSGPQLPEWAQILAGIAHILDPASWGQ